VRDALRLSGWAGLVLFVMGLVSYAFSGTFDLWTAVHVAGGGLLLAVAVAGNLAGVRRTVAARGTRERAQAVTGTLVFGAILVTVNVLAARYPKTWDATESKVFTLGDKTRSVLSSLERPVELAAFFPPGDRARPEMEELLKRYASLSGKLTWRFVDAEKEPQLADQFGVTRAGVLAARSGNEKAQSSGDAAGSIGEGEVTSLILKVARPTATVVYAMTGHGEPEPSDLESPAGLGLLVRALGEDAITVKPLLLSTQAAVPEDAAAVILAGPVKPLIAHEQDAVRSYLAKGGRLLAMIDPGSEPGLAPLLDDYRLKLDDDMIVDQQEVAFLGARLGVDPIVEDFPPLPITKGFKQRIILSRARSVTIGVDGGLPGVSTQPLAKTHESAWGESGWHEMLKTGRVEKSAEDKAGPVVVAATATVGGAGRKESRLVLVGDSDWAVNGNLGSFFNREMLLNTVHWLTGSEELIVGPAKRLRASRLDMTVADERNLFRFGVLLLPEVLLIGGLAAWLRRKSL
jgi:ABC-type uncharacterized transport system involved in gliding motility auxiliary subunit